SPTEVQPVLDAIAESARRLCAASDALIFLLEDASFRLTAHSGTTTVLPLGSQLPFKPSILSARVILERRTISLADIAAELDAEYGETKALAARFGLHSVASIPLLRESTPIGSIVLVRTEVAPFSEADI